jgi:hypothetical protein
VTRDGFWSLIGCVGAAVLLGACGHGSPTATHASSAPPTSSASATTASEIATTTAAQPAPLASFVGTWEKHGEKLVIDGAGTGNWTYADWRLCASCSSAEMPAGTVAFTLTSVSNGVASGSVSASSDAQSGAVGDTVTARIVPGYEGKGVNLQLDIGASTAEVFCNSTSAGQCGA